MIGYAVVEAKVTSCVRFIRQIVLATINLKFYVTVYNP